jgi:O-antigen/teichoic acid export membrane protein
VAVIRMILQSYRAAVQPVAAQTFESSNEDFKRFCTKSLRYILLITVPIALGTTALAGRLVSLLFGPQFADTGPVLVLLIWTLIPYGGMLVFASFLISSNNQHVDLRINAIGIITAVVSCLLLIPTFGAKGAAVAVLFSMTLFLAQQIVFVQRHLFHVDWIHIGWKIVTAGILMGVVIAIGLLPLGLEIIVGVLVYGLMLIVLKEPTLLEFRKYRLIPPVSGGVE